MQMGEKITLLTDKGEFYLYRPECKLTDSAYWNKNFKKTAKEDIETYLGRQAFGYTDDVNHLAKQFHRDDRPLAQTVSLIPVAAHQESERILPAMAEFAKQETEDPFSVLLYLNTPVNADYLEIRKTERAISKSWQEFPHLDLRVSLVHEFDNPVIGNIRKNLWDAALFLGYVEGLFDNGGDVIAFNHDIDIEWMHKKLVKNVQDYYKVRMNNAAWANDDHLKPAGTDIRHAYDPKRPNVSKVVHWRDFVTRHRSPEATFEAGLIVPLSTYVRSDGIQATAETYEITNIVQKSGLAPRIPQTRILTSPRRFGERLHYVNLDEVWTDNTFGADDVCRSDNPEGDISDDRAWNLMAESLDDYMTQLFYVPAVKYINGDRSFDLTEKLKKRKRLAVTALGHLDESGQLAKHVKKEYKIKSMAADIRSGHLPSFFTTEIK
jgi:hypothetical protein